MKLIRFRENGKEKPGVILDEKYFDASSFGEDYSETFFENDGLTRLQKFIQNNRTVLKEIARDTELAAPFGRPSKIVCIGLNYASHAKETGAAVPPEPVVFMKSTTALIGPNDAIIIPKNSKKTYWGVELGGVIGTKRSYVEEADAMNYVAGYCLHNDVSEREFQLERNGTWDKGKGCDTFAPIGPFLATKDEVKDVNNLRLWFFCFVWGVVGVGCRMCVGLLVVVCGGLEYSRFLMVEFGD